MISSAYKNYLALLSSSLLTLFSFTNSAVGGDAHTRLEKEVRRFIDSSKVSVVTVTSRFSREVDVEQESGILSFFKSEVKKQSLSYVNVGTGIIFDDQGHLLTRSSIVLGADHNMVTLSSGQELEASFLGHDPETGFSVLKLSGSGYKPANLQNSGEISAGSGTVMIGNSLGVFPSIFVGTVNGVMADGMIQISINLNPGSNGSPIYNFTGEVVGVVAGRLNVEQNSSPPFAGFHYNEPTLAYPINWVKRVAEDISEHSYVRKGWLGVVGYYDGHKPKIREIREGSPAEQAGLIKGDIIVKFGNADVGNISELIHLVEWTKPGSHVVLEFMRANQPMHKEVQIGEKTPSPVASTTAERFNVRSAASTVESAGPDLRNLIQRNQFLEMRISYLEKEIKELKALLESR